MVHQKMPIWDAEVNDIFDFSNIFHSDGRSWRHLNGGYRTTKAMERPTGLEAMGFCLLSESWLQRVYSVT